MSTALYRKYRSKKLSEIVGQDHVTNLLARALKKGIIAHAYLLTGPRGVGKTSIARILAHEINHLPYDDKAANLDIIEIDAASNNGVEDVRDLRDKVQIAPVAADKKIYIIDEVHMLSKPAFNALLKTLEEPPEHVVFILATTDVEKIPATIISRTQRYSFRAIAPADAVKHLRMIADKEKIAVTDDALQLIALRGDGSFRDSISLLDQLRHLTDGTTKITKELIEQSLGLAPSELIQQLLTAYTAKDLKTIVALLDDSEARGIGATTLASQLTQYIRAQLADTPQLVELLDGLLEVGKSSQPNIKLLTVLAAHAVPKPKSAALSAPAPEVSAPIKELEKQAITRQEFAPSTATVELKQTSPHQEPAASDSRVSADVSEGSSASSTPNSTPARVTRDEATPPEPTNGSEGGVAVSRGPHELPVRGVRAAGPADSDLRASSNGIGDDGSGSRDGSEEASENSPILDWQRLIDHTRTGYVAIYSVLTKCGYAQDGTKLTIYTGTNFWKKKLDDSKHRINLVKALEEIGAANLSIETVPTPPPPKDSQAAAVAAIMGGGEEVSL